MFRSGPSPLRLSIFIAVGLMWFAAAFGGGYLLGQADAYAGRDQVATTISRLAARVGVQSPLVPSTPATTLTAEQQERFKVFWEAWSLVQREFYNRQSIDPQKMTYGAVKGMVEAVGDPYTFFSSPRERELNESSIRGSFDGIGIQVDQRDGRLRVVAPIEGTPAERAGIKAGDVITKVDDKDLRNVALNDVVQLIRGPRGTTVRLTITREGVAQPLVISVERAEIKLESVRGKLLDNGFGYVRITTFSQTTGTEIDSWLKRLLGQHPRGMVLDLRSNPGGYLTAAVDVTSQFLGSGVVLYQQQSSGERQEYRVRPGGQATSVPLVVLIDKGSASASEIVAAALRDNGRAQLVGERSYGKGTVQTVHTLSDRSGLRITTGAWLTPSGQPLEKQGLEPDLAVTGQQDTAANSAASSSGAANSGSNGTANGAATSAANSDPQLDAAVRLLETQLGQEQAPPRV
jgi:carboxyl-terminal processing protease